MKRRTLLQTMLSAFPVSVLAEKPVWQAYDLGNGVTADDWAQHRPVVGDIG